ncbi:hypothetical protein OPV22_034861 [Ensete ventricosum]|uniref:Uncharacterized protein n=1 Tax=Ensete ventricosum TaxID=4639 RepID=A0AAV8P0K4_ENSVE|nr:hypothetical protein OPV22_034861 [Ensete ventricosum]
MRLPGSTIYKNRFKDHFTSIIKCHRWSAEQQKRGDATAVGSTDHVKQHPETLGSSSSARSSCSPFKVYVLEQDDRLL